VIWICLDWVAIEFILEHHVRSRDLTKILKGVERQLMAVPQLVMAIYCL